MMKENVGSVKKVYLKPLMEFLFIDVTSSIVAASPHFGGDAGDAPDENPLSAKHDEYFEEDV